MITLIHREDMRKLDVGQHIVVGTPGRVFDMISRKVLVDRCNSLIIMIIQSALYKIPMANYF